jgi:hypothetical protein
VSLGIAGKEEPSVSTPLLKKEMQAIDCALEDDNVMPPGYLKINCHMVFDVKMTLERKAHYVAGGHQTEPSKDITFASVVLRDSIQIAFLVTALNNLEILSTDISGAYLNTLCGEKVYTIAHKEFGPDKEGQPVLIKCALTLQASIIWKGLEGSYGCNFEGLWILVL